MEFFDNMNQGNLDENPEQQNNMQDNGEGAGAGGDDAAGFSFDTSTGPASDSEAATTGEEGAQGESSEEGNEKPKRKSRKKKADTPADAEQGIEGDEGASSVSEGSDLSEGESDPDAYGEPEGDAGDEGADTDQPDGVVPEDTGEGDVGFSDPEGGLPLDWPPDESLPDGFTPDDGTPLDLLDSDSGMMADAEGAAPEPEDTGPPGERPARQPGRRQAASRRPAVLDASGNAIFERTDSGQHDMSVLTAARNSRRVLTATVDGIETDGEALPRVVFYLGTVKVMIPFSQMGFDLDPEPVSQREARLLIDSMRGARIDYMVRGVDTEARVAGASRRDAMLMRQRTILNARGTSTEYKINEGMRVMARVIHVSRNTVRVEVYGYESYIRIDGISNLWVNDIREVNQVGEKRPVEIVSLRRDESGRVTAMRVSMKAAEDAPQLELREGNTYTGTISNFSDTAYFVRVAGIPMEVR